MSRLITKALILIVALALASITAFAKNANSANNTVKVEYRTLNYYANKEMRKFAGLFDFIGVRYMETVVTGKLKGKKITLLLHYVEDTTTETETFPLEAWMFENDTLLITFTAFAIDGKVKFRVVPHTAFIITLPIEYETYKSHHLQMTGLKDALIGGTSKAGGWYSYYLTTEKTFPVMGFIAPLEACIQGDPFVEMHPKLWRKEFGMKNYIYFEVKIGE